ncbi:hypothetical protein AB7C87_01960 [Natrarchaeobius sp. A-rgal3]|uniref:hypothetical protein n=1 Tax=Natrarchaeobius versutus TaxID=1679078 RepID=UPI0035104363
MSTRDSRTGDADDREEPSDEPVTIEFIDRETVRIGGDLEDAILSLCWWDESGRVGTISEPVGGVDGERVVSASEEFGEFAYGPIVTAVEGFTDRTPAVPGTGDLSASNPDVDSHVAAVRGEYDGSAGLEDPFPS